MHPAARHLTPWPARSSDQVRGQALIELPISGELDINGWDLGKALKLLLKGDAVVIEWLQSPLVYAVDPWFRAEMLPFAGRFARCDWVALYFPAVAPVPGGLAS